MCRIPSSAGKPKPLLRRSFIFDSHFEVLTFREAPSQLYRKAAALVLIRKSTSLRIFHARDREPFEIERDPFETIDDCDQVYSALRLDAPFFWKEVHRDSIVSHIEPTSKLRLVGGLIDCRNR